MLENFESLLSSSQWEMLFGAIALVLGLVVVLVTGEILQWIISSGRDKPSIRNALRFGYGRGGPPSSTGSPLDILLLFFQPPFLLGTIFWIAVFYFMS